MAILPTSRAHLTTKPRSDFSAAGEDSTFHGTFTNVPLPDTRRMHMISRKDKKAIFSDMRSEGQAPKHWRYSGVPLFWRESKSKDFWKHLLEAFDIMAVVDLTPGSGALAVEAMRRGATYLGVCSHTTHQTWLQNAIDKEALALITESGTPLYQQELAEHIQEQYKDILEDLNGQDELTDLENSDVDANGS